MPKTPIHQKDLYDGIPFHEEEFSTESMVDLLEAGQHHLEITLELTKLIVSKDPNLNNEEAILATFRRVAQSLSEDFV